MSRPPPLWVPSPDRSARSRLHAFMAEIGPRDGPRDGYDELWRWSVDPATAGDFWSAVATWAGVGWHDQPEATLEADAGRVSGYRWFRGATLNYAERALTPPPAGLEAVAVVAHSQTRPRAELTWAELRDLVAGVRAGLVAAGVERGDRVAGYLPNVPEALAALLAAASLGAVWACCAPEMAAPGALDRLGQVDPAVLIAVDGYRYGDRELDRRDDIESLRQALPRLRSAVWLPYLHPGRAPAPGWTSWADFTAAGQPAAGLDFEPVPFDHPLYVLFSSGTTGRPKPIVHGHGGMVLEHAKALGLHFDLGPGDRFFWFTTTGWMMWNFCVSGLLTGSTVVLMDGNPTWPQAGSLWEMIDREAVTCAGVGSAFLVAGLRAGLTPNRGAPNRDGPFEHLVTLGATGSPLPGPAAEWAYQQIKADLMVGSFSGGTDVCTGFVGPSPLHPVWAGEISCRCLGAAVDVFDDHGAPVVGREGELVLTAPLPSMPVGFWGDPDGSRYHAAYFERFPGVWAHGDRAELTERGSVIITGRSDGTLNRGGVRMGTAEFYSVVEDMEAVADSLVVHLEDPGGGPGELVLFVVPASATEPTGARQLIDAVTSELRRRLSARHVPDRIALVAAIPRTLSGKKMEVPVKRILTGADPDATMALESVADPATLQPFLSFRLSAPPRPVDPADR